MKIEKTDYAETLPQESEFTFSPNPVQGARLGKLENKLFVRSPRRYKLYTQGRDIVCFLEGKGHFKWARGEKDFAAGECFAAESCGEYEINGSCTFIVVREE